MGEREEASPPTTPWVPPRKEALLKGWLLKRSSPPFRRWQRRWFVLYEDIFAYYRDNPEGGGGEEEIRAQVPLYRITAVAQEADNPTRFTVRTTDPSRLLYEFCSETAELAHVWVHTLKCVLGEGKDALLGVGIAEEEETREEEKTREG